MSSDTVFLYKSVPYYFDPFCILSHLISTAESYSLLNDIIIKASNQSHNKIQPIFLTS